KPAIKGIYAPIGRNHPVNEIGGEFRFFVQVVFDSALHFQLDGIGKRNSGDPAAESSGVDAQDQESLVGVAIVSIVKLPCKVCGYFVLVRIHYRYTVGKGGGNGEGMIEIQDLLRLRHGYCSINCSSLSTLPNRRRVSSFVSSMSDEIMPITFLTVCT